MDWLHFLLEHLLAIVVCAMALLVVLAVAFCGVHSSAFNAGQKRGFWVGYRVGKYDERRAMERDEPVTYGEIIETRADGTKVRHQL